MKKSISFMLVVIMVLCLVPSVAMATDPVAQIGDATYLTLKAAMDAAAGMNGDVTIELLADVEWETGAANDSTPLIPASSSVGNVTIEGNGKTFTATGKGVGSIRSDNGKKLIFKNLIVVDSSVAYTEQAWEYTYLEFGGDLEFEGVDFTDGIMIEGNSAKFTNCSFSGHNNDSSSNSDVTMHSVWVYNGRAEFNNCTFTGTRGAKIHEDYGSDVTSVSFNNCAFGPLTEMPGVAIGTLDSTTTVNIQGCTFENCKDIYYNPAEPWEDPFDEESHIPGVLQSCTDISTFNFTYVPYVAPAPTSSGSGISVTYNGGNSFSTSNSAVPTGVEIDGVPVTFNGDGRNFSVGCISSDAKWVTVRWNSTSVTTNFTPDGLVECATVAIPKTGDMPFWAAIAEFFGF